MIYNVYLRRAAERDVFEAQQWYEQQQAGLAAEFNAEFNALIDRLAEAPFLYPQKYRRTAGSAAPISVSDLVSGARKPDHDTCLYAWQGESDQTTFAASLMCSVAWR
ncbi:hypothetical protein [Salinisphaera sp. S4-8]|uniref:hypothetical protein n=1 Tax=Salinisphaera sp. S4-8 TaxID=633357 RepID=UPI003340A6FE